MPAPATLKTTVAVSPAGGCVDSSTIGADAFAHAPSTAAAKAARNVRPPMELPPPAKCGRGRQPASRPNDAVNERCGGYFLAGAPAVSILQVPSKKTPRSMTMAAVVRLPRTLAGAFSSMPFDAVASPW